MSKIQWKGSTLLAPLPVVMVSCGSEEKPNIITVAWTGIINSNPPKMYISVRPERFSYEIIKESGEFVVNLVSEKMVRAADFCGIFTGKKIDKFDKNNLHTEISNVVSCPSIEESPISIECKVDRVIPLGSHDMFIADIVSVNVAEELLDEDGKLRIERAKLASFSHGEYFAQGRIVGRFGYSAAKKPKNQNRQRNVQNSLKNEAAVDTNVSPKSKKEYKSDKSKREYNFDKPKKDSYSKSEDFAKKKKYN